MQENYIIVGEFLVTVSWTEERKCWSWALNGYTENGAAMVGADVGISLHL